MNSRVSVVEVLILADVALDTAEPGGCTPLYVATEKGHAYVVKLLVEAGARQRPYQGATPLFAAVQLGFASIVSFLVQDEVIEADYKEIPPLYMAAQGGCNVIVKMLPLEAGASVHRTSIWCIAFTCCVRVRT